jgi:16S rRNA (guanine527-N7)-methyltransferase
MNQGPDPDRASPVVPGAGDVSRETTRLSFGGEAPSAPAEAAQVFRTRLPLAVRYADHLAHAGVERGLIGPREVDRLWARHLLNSAAIAAWVPQGVPIADVGSGAGLPGIPLALARPDLHLTLIEPLLRRATFLSEVVADLGLADQVEVVRARAEELHGRRRFPWVTARAVAPLDRLAGWCLPLLDPHGTLLALKGESAADEVAATADALARAGAEEVDVVTTAGPDGPIRAVLVGVGAEPIGAGEGRTGRARGTGSAGRSRKPRRRSR